MTRDPASIRFNNPGAQYPGPSARRFGTTGTEIIGGGHQIAKFDDPVQGASAMFDLLRRRYAGLSLEDAIRRWSGGNSSSAYAARVAQETGLQPGTILGPELLSNPAVAVPLARTMASWEAGRPYPMTDDQWSSAHKMALGGPAPSTSGIPSATFDPATGQLGPKPLAMTAPTPDEAAGVARFANPNILQATQATAPTQVASLDPIETAQSPAPAPGMLDFNDPQLGGSAVAFANQIGKMLSANTPRAPSVDTPRMAGPQIDLSSVMKVLAARNGRKLGLG